MTKQVTKDEIRKQTFISLNNLLEEYGEGVIIRPTGFGKTYLLTDLIAMPQYKNILYLYPVEVIKKTVVNRYVDNNFSDYDEETKETLKAMENLEGVTLMTYAKLIRLEEQDFINMNYDLIICDECHRLGGTKTKYAISRLKEHNPKAHFVGATATPNRGDSFDVVDEFYDNHCVFEYTYHDAFQDGILQKPYYCYCSYDAETDLKEAALTAGEDFENIKVWEVIKKGLIEISKIYNMPNIIREICIQYAQNEGHDQGYYKFIVFSSSIDDLNTKKDIVKGWFKEAFPGSHINELIVSSETDEYTNNVNKLDTLTFRENTIDLIFCIDMLNMGYHVNDMTGLLMYRCTSSDIIYIQQLGRALSSGNENSCIVFDVVDNLHRKALFDFSEDSFLIGPGADTTGGKDGGDIGTNGGSMTIIGGNGEGSDLGTDGGDSGVHSDPPGGIGWWRHNKIDPMDLYAVGNIATYKELIAKIVAEPMAQRCREAFEAHFHRWCILNNIPYPISDADLKSIYNMNKEDFIAYFKKLIDDNKIDYPMGDVRKLLEIGKKEQDGIPMEIFAKWKNVSVSAILELLDVA